MQNILYLEQKVSKVEQLAISTTKEKNMDAIVNFRYNFCQSNQISKKIFSFLLLIGMFF